MASCASTDLGRVPLLEGNQDGAGSTVAAKQEGGLRVEGILKPQGNFGPAVDCPPLVSVIIVTFNAAAFFGRAIASLRRLDYPNFECIVVDGASTDGTVDMLRLSNVDIDYWVSEPDGGIYDAMNKGIDLARGAYLYFLGADDELLEIPRELADRRYDLVCGAVDCRSKHFPAGDIGLLRSRMRYRNAIHPQGTFYIRTEIRYDTRYRRCADYRYNIEHLQCCKRFLRLDRTLAVFHPGGASSGWAAKAEVIEIARQSFGTLAGLRSTAYHLASAARTAVKPPAVS